MGAVVGTLVELGYGVAWRVLDAQHFGVPQRRRRVFIVAERSGDPARAAQVLFERTSVRGDSSQGRAQGQDTPRGAGQGAAEPTLYEPHHNDARSSTGIANTLVSRMGTGGGQVPLAIEPTGFNAYAGIDIQAQVGSSTALKVGDGGGASVMVEPVAFDEMNFTTTEMHQTLRAGTPQSTGIVEPANGGGDYELLASRALPQRHGCQSGCEQRSSDYYNFQGFGAYASGDTASTMKARDYKDATDLVVHQDTPSAE